MTFKAEKRKYRIGLAELQFFLSGGQLMHRVSDGRFRSYIVLWPTSEDGLVLKDAVPTLERWDYGLDIATKLQAIHEEWGACEHDIMLVPEPGVDLMPCKSALLFALRIRNPEAWKDLEQQLKDATSGDDVWLMSLLDCVGD